MLEFNHSGALQWQATITFDVGKQYAGQILYFCYYNPDTGELEYWQSAVVGDK